MSIFGFAEGTDFHQPFAFKDSNGTVINLTLATDLQCLVVEADGTILLTLTVGSGITVTDAVNGKATVSITAAQSTGQTADYRYEISCTLASGDVVLLSRGEIHITPSFVGA